MHTNVADKRILRDQVRQPEHIWFKNHLYEINTYASILWFANTHENILTTKLK